mmetsp:Transcript_1653/g.3657  ORF Transcript_1653/g.3657 Transcript_1653/m.3657 type:complete len:211 (-) Transcript_1653:301-933(-)
MPEDTPIEAASKARHLPSLSCGASALALTASLVRTSRAAVAIVCLAQGGSLVRCASNLALKRGNIALRRSSLALRACTTSNHVALASSGRRGSILGLHTSTTRPWKSLPCKYRYSSSIWRMPLPLPVALRSASARKPSCMLSLCRAVQYDSPARRFITLLSCSRSQGLPNFNPASRHSSRLAPKWASAPTGGSSLLEFIQKGSWHASAKR